MDFKIVQATKNDVPEIMEELKAFSEFYDTKLSLCGDYEHLKKVVEVFIQDHVFLLATKATGELIGLISGVIAPHVYNPSILALSESFWWVKEKYRGSRVGLYLLEEFISFGKENTDWTIMVLEADSPVREETLTKRGFKLKEKSYLLERGA